MYDYITDSFRSIANIELRSDVCKNEIHISGFVSSDFWFLFNYKKSKASYQIFKSMLISSNEGDINDMVNEVIVTMGNIINNDVLIVDLNERICRFIILTENFSNHFKIYYDEDKVLTQTIKESYKNNNQYFWCYRKSLLNLLINSRIICDELISDKYHFENTRPDVDFYFKTFTFLKKLLNKENEFV